MLISRSHRAQMLLWCILRVPSFVEYFPHVHYGSPLPAVLHLLILKLAYKTGVASCPKSKLS